VAIATSTFVLHPRGAGFRNPELVYGDFEDQGDLVNMEEQILCIAACGIRSNPIWNPIVSRGNSWSCPQESEASEQPAADAAVDIPSLEGVEAEDLVGEERFEPSEPSDCHPRPPPISVLELNLGIVDDEIRDEIACLQKQWTRYYEQVHTVTDLLRSKWQPLNKTATIFQTMKGTLSKVYALAFTKDEKRPAVVVDRETRLNRECQ
jgi:hypothetical protein